MASDPIKYFIESYLKFVKINQLSLDLLSVLETSEMMKNRRRNSSIDSKLSAIFAGIVLVCVCVCALPLGRKCFWVFHAYWFDLVLIASLLFMPPVIVDSYKFFCFFLFSSLMWFHFIFILLLPFLIRSDNGSFAVAEAAENEQISILWCVIVAAKRVQPKHNETRNNLVIKIIRYIVLYFFLMPWFIRLICAFFVFFVLLLIFLV